VFELARVCLVILPSGYHILLTQKNQTIIGLTLTKRLIMKQGIWMFDSLDSILRNQSRVCHISAQNQK